MSENLAELLKQRKAALADPPKHREDPPIKPPDRVKSPKKPKDEKPKIENEADLVEKVVTQLKDALIVPLANEILALKEKITTLDQQFERHILSNIEADLEQEGINPPGESHIISPEDLNKAIRKKYNIPISECYQNLENYSIPDADDLKFLKRYGRSKSDFDLYFELTKRYFI